MRSLLAATAAWPKLMPPSFGGTMRCSSTRKPEASSRARVDAARRRFWNVPPERTTVSPPKARHSATEEAATVSWNAAAISLRGRPAGASSATRATSAVVSPKRQRHGSAGGVAGEQLELDRSLSLVRDALPHPEHRRDRVEEAAHPRRERSVDGEGSPHALPLGPRDEDAGALEMDGRDPPRLAHRGLAAGKRNRLEPREPLVALEVGAQELAAPERSVGPVAGAVEDEGERRPRLAVLGEARSRVRVVMLHLDQRQALLVRPFVERYSGWRSYATASGSTRSISR